MSEAKPIPVEEKPSNIQPKANSLPREKTALSRVTSSPVLVGDTPSIGATLRRRSDLLFHSNEQLRELPKDETDSGRRSNASTISTSSEDEERNRSASTTSPDQPSIDAWLQWRKNKNNRRNSSPVVNYGSSLGTSV